MANKTSSGGMGCGTTIFVVFLILKLTHLIDWSWWWVTSSLWIGLVLFFFGAAIFVFFAGLAILIFGRK